MIVFNSTNWNISQDVLVFGTANQVLYDSPYAGRIQLRSFSRDPVYDVLNATTGLGFPTLNITVLVSEKDQGRLHRGG